MATSIQTATPEVIDQGISSQSYDQLIKDQLGNYQHYEGLVRGYVYEDPNNPGTFYFDKQGLDQLIQLGEIDAERMARNFISPVDGFDNEATDLQKDIGQAQENYKQDIRDLFDYYSKIDGISEDDPLLKLITALSATAGLGGGIAFAMWGIQVASDAPTKAARLRLTQSMRGLKEAHLRNDINVKFNTELTAAEREKLKACGFNQFSRYAPGVGANLAKLISRAMFSLSKLMAVVGLGTVASTVASAVAYEGYNLLFPSEEKEMLDRPNIDIPMSSPIVPEANADPVEHFKKLYVQSKAHFEFSDDVSSLTALIEEKSDKILDAINDNNFDEAKKIFEEDFKKIGKQKQFHDPQTYMYYAAIYRDLEVIFGETSMSMIPGWDFTSQSMRAYPTLTNVVLLGGSTFVAGGGVWTLSTVIQGEDPMQWTNEFIRGSKWYEGAEDFERQASQTADKYLEDALALADAQGAECNVNELDLNRYVEMIDTIEDEQHDTSTEPKTDPTETSDSARIETSETTPQEFPESLPAPPGEWYTAEHISQLTTNVHNLSQVQGEGRSHALHEAEQMMDDWLDNVINFFEEQGTLGNAIRNAFGIGGSISSGALWYDNELGPLLESYGKIQDMVNVYRFNPTDENLEQIASSMRQLSLDTHKAMEWTPSTDLVQGGPMIVVGAIGATALFLGGGEIVLGGAGTGAAIAAPTTTATATSTGTMTTAISAGTTIESGAMATGGMTAANNTFWYTVSTQGSQAAAGLLAIFGGQQVYQEVSSDPQSENPQF